MFACGVYPWRRADRSKHWPKAAAAVKRLRHHPSLSGAVGRQQRGLLHRAVHPLLRRAADRNPRCRRSRAADARFDGRQLYEQILPAAVAAHDSGPAGLSRPYWPGSPTAATAPTLTPKTKGDCPLWDVWHSPLRRRIRVSAARRSLRERVRHASGAVAGHGGAGARGAG